MTTKCEICGKECKTEQGLAGHKRLGHKMNTAEELPTQMTTEERLDDLEEFIRELVIQTARIPGLLKTCLDCMKGQSEIISYLITLLKDVKAKYDSCSLQQYTYLHDIIE